MQNAYLLANIGLDTAEDGPSEVSLKNKEPGGRGVKNVKRQGVSVCKYLTCIFNILSMHCIVFCIVHLKQAL